MPETLGSLVAFLFFVTPGLAFELLRERARPARKYLTFRETAVVVVASVVFTTTAILILVLIRVQWPDSLADPGALFDSPSDYTADHLSRVSFSLLMLVALSVTLAWVFHRVLCSVGPAAKISPNPTWFELIDGTANPQGKRKGPVLATAELHDGSAIRGNVKGYELTDDGVLQVLVLHGTQDGDLKARAPGGEMVDYPEGWAYAVISADRIKHVTLAYLSPDSNTP